MTKVEDRAKVIASKALLERDEGFARAAVQGLVRAALEAEMTEALGGAVKRIRHHRFPLSILRNHETQIIICVMARMRPKPVKRKSKGSDSRTIWFWPKRTKIIDRKIGIIKYPRHLMAISPYPAFSAAAALPQFCLSNHAAGPVSSIEKRRPCTRLLLHL
jgi:hypothetical protein